MPKFEEAMCLECLRPTPFRRWSDGTWRCDVCRVYAYENGLPPWISVFKINFKEVHQIHITAEGIVFYGEGTRAMFFWGPTDPGIDQLKQVTIGEYLRTDESRITDNRVEIPMNEKLWECWREHKSDLKALGFKCEKDGADRFHVYCSVLTIQQWQARESLTEVAPDNQRDIEQLVTLDRKKELNRDSRTFDRFEDLLKGYLTENGARVTAVVINPHEDRKPFTTGDMDDRFSYYQFLKFKLRDVDYVFTILPYAWFTEKVAVNPAETFPKTDDRTILRLLKLKEAQSIPWRESEGEQLCASRNDCQ
jgi:hypothetical protein